MSDGRTMEELFRLKIVGKRQITLPPRMMNALKLDEGDELQVEVWNGQIKAVRPLKLVPTDLFTPDLLSKLNEREMEVQSGNRTAVDEAGLRAAQNDDEQEPKVMGASKG